MTSTVINTRHEYGKGVYEEVALIGNGAYGTVYKARDLENGRFVALKKIRIPSNAEELGMPMSAMREIATLKQLDNFEHPNIVRWAATGLVINRLCLLTLDLIPTFMRGRCTIMPPLH